MWNKLVYYVRVAWNFVQLGLDWLVYYLVKAWDMFERQDAQKKKNPEKFRMGRIKLWVKYNIIARIDGRKLTLKEQKAFIENLLLGFRFERPDIDTIRFVANSHVFRPSTILRFKYLERIKPDLILSRALEDSEVLDYEYIALIKVAEDNTLFDEIYNLIIEDIDDRLDRQKAFRKMMQYPVITIISILFTEIYVAVSVIPMMMKVTVIEDFSNAPVLHSYVKLADFITNPSIWTFILPVLIVLACIIIYNMNSFKWTLDLVLLMIPRLNTIIIKWQTSKMFNSLRSLARTKNPIYDNTIKSVEVISNRIIRESLRKDIRRNIDEYKQPYFYDMFRDSVYIEPFILEQLRYSKEIDADPTLILESVYRENKHIMKDIMETPAQVLGILVSVIIGAYIILRLLPIYPELMDVMDDFY